MEPNSMRAANPTPYCDRLLRLGVLLFLLGLLTGFAIPALVNFGRDLALDKQLGELASLSLGFDCHTSRLLVAAR